MSVTRRNKRLTGRCQDDAQSVANQLGANFLAFFSTASDPEGKEVTEKYNQIDLQWRLYCHRINARPEAFPHLKNYMDDVIKDYFKLKSIVKP